MPFTPINPDLAQADLQEIKQLIPHRYPFLFIDRVVNIEHRVGAMGLKNVTANEPFFEGHFPAEPVMPGVLIIEALAQTATTLVSHEQDLGAQGKVVYFMGIEKTRFRRKVVPGDQLELLVKALRVGGKVFKFEGTALVEGEVAASTEFMAMVADPETNN